MKKIIFTLLILSHFLKIYGQSGWTELNAIGETQPFSGIPQERNSPASFVIGNSIYYGTGGVDLGLQYSERSDFSFFTCSTNRWSASTYFSGAPRMHAIAFSDSLNGFVALGNDDNGNNYTDNWCFDPTSGTWTQKSSFPGAFRSNGFYFTTGKKLYFGNGFDNVNNFSDFWMYDPVVNTWIQKNDPPFSPIKNAHGFGIGLFGFVCGGTDSLNNFMSTVYKYDPNNDSWVTAGIFPGTGIGFSFATDSFAYASNSFSFYQYNPITSGWTAKANVPVPSCEAAVGISDKGYIIQSNSTVCQYDEQTDIWQTVFNSPAGNNFGTSTSVVYGDTVYINSSKYNFITDTWVFNPSFSYSWLWRSGSKAGRVLFGGGFELFDFSTYSTFPASQLPGGFHISFTAGGRYFAGIGFDTTGAFDNHLYEYDFANDVWIQKSLYPGAGSEYMIAFGIDSFGYVGGGIIGGSNAATDFWMYNPSTDQWTMKASIAADEGGYAFSSSYNGKGYIGLGMDGYQGNDGCEVYSYNVSTDAWSLVQSPFGCRHRAYAFSAGNNLFAGGGFIRYSPNYSESFADLWKYDDATTDVKVIDDENFSVKTTPSGNSIIISGIKNNSTIRIFDLAGRVLINTIATGINVSVNTSDFVESVYFVVVGDKVRKFGLVR